MIFTINGHSHWSNKLVYKVCNLLTWDRRISYRVRFDSSAYYIDGSLDRYDVNKLFGFSIGLHHQNSARFGWNCLDGKIVIYSYTYVDGFRNFNEIARVDVNTEYILTIHDKGSYYSFSVIDDDGNLAQDIVLKRLVHGPRFRLWPYFGGNKTAPHKIKIELNDN